MKLRLGFVSNSSSSSFVFALPKERQKKCPTCGNSFEITQLAEDFEQPHEGISVEYHGEARKAAKWLMREWDWGGYDEGYHDDDLDKVLNVNDDLEVFVTDVGYDCRGFCRAVSRIPGYVELYDDGC